MQINPQAGPQQAIFDQLSFFVKISLIFNYKYIIIAKNTFIKLVLNVFPRSNWFSFLMLTDRVTWYVYFIQSILIIVADYFSMNSKIFLVR